MATDPSSRLQVVIRVRPPLPRELNGFRPFQLTTLVDPSCRLMTLSENLPMVHLQPKPRDPGG